jgi:hypothetical protein
VLHRSVVRSIADPTHRNERVTFKSDTQESLEKLDTMTSNSHSKKRSRNTNHDVSNRTRFKADSIN